jgi:hypothetical protein
MEILFYFVGTRHEARSDLARENKKDCNEKRDSN